MDWDDFKSKALPDRLYWPLGSTAVIDCSAQL